MSKNLKVKSLKGIGEVPVSIWKKIGQGIIARIRTDAQKGISQDDKHPRFKKYSKEYRDFKSKGYAFHGRATDSQVNPPNLKYTGNMLKNISVGGATKAGVLIAFNEGERVRWNIKNDRFTANRNIFDVREKNMQWAVNKIKKQIDTNMKKASGTSKVKMVT